MRRSGTADEIIDQTYEAAVVPELWPQALENLATSVDATGGILFVARGSEIRWTSSPGTFELMSAFVNGGWDQRNSRAARVAAMNHPGFVHDLDLFTSEEMDHDPFYTELCRPMGFGWAAGTLITAPNDDMIVYSLDRRFEMGPYDRPAVDLLNMMRPHLARAGLMAARLQLERARTAADTLGALGLPCAILSADGRVIAANPLLEKMDGHVRIGALNRLQLVSRQANSQLQEAVGRLRDRLIDSILSFPVPGHEADMAVMHLIPVRRSAHDIFNSAAGIAILTPLAKPRPPAESLLNGLFDLTPSEARVARGLASGSTPRIIAGRLGISYETVRNHIKTILAKTGMHRQADLIALLGSASAPRFWPEKD